jgi:NAD+ diphosphatase
MIFTPDFKPARSQSGPALWFLFDEGHLLTKINADRFKIPNAVDLEALQISPFRQPVSGIAGRSAMLRGCAGTGQFALTPISTESFANAFRMIPDTLIWIAGRGNQFLHWHLTHRYCGKCGRETENKTDERAKICPRCQHINYPRLSPAVIVAIVKDDRILLARNRKYKGSFYSVLAGFVEPGESLEQCVRREIKEEVGISVKNVRYFGSQPWPFPDALMIAFVSDYDAGEIAVDGSEIIEAAWFSKDELPRIPPKISIARQLIDWFAQL